VSGPQPALVLSGSIGKGHDSVAEACASALARAGYRSTVLDCMALLGGVGSRIGESVFRRMLAVPPLYDGFHFSQMRAGSPLAERMERAAAARLVPRLRDVIARSGVQVLVSVFATGAGALGRLRAELPGARAVVVCTDATAHRFWVHEGIDRYVVCSPAAAGTVRQYLPRADVALVPPPVRPAFFAAPDRLAARRALGIHPAVRCVLVMAGGWGLAPIEGAATALARSGYRVLAVAGANARLRRRLERAARAVGSARGAPPGAAVDGAPPGAGGGPPGAGRPAGAVFTAGSGPGITVFGYTERVPELMAAADVVVTSAGQTCHEARVVGRPLVVLDVVPGHGRENLLLELARGGALACTPRPASVVAAVGALLAGAAPATEPWPVSDAAAWESRFLAVVADLFPPAGRHRPGDAVATADGRDRMQPSRPPHGGADGDAAPSGEVASSR